MNALFSNQACAPRRSVIRTMAVMAVVGACAAAGSFAVQAAETTGRIFGHAPPGSTVVIGSDEYAIQRSFPVNDEGRYLATWLPVGVYTVTVLDNGQPLARHPSVQIYVDRGSRVDLGCAGARCREVAAN
ncbi:carboxypeptidase-like regulatory domain-containing protein [Frateuria terrea]|uniref:Carboxypeptidase regulatory-like domain-containing protein n=1 Tax=Frateuria terrea TaxID=529704 RepID=A0A1H6UN50_9GAMM|nr:carboxypeptidase-like regulatory domain-containing protein [Frateuria terrea]SEI91177.1 hypothetical protein SAMN04487997_2012 [Frateuria terrea]SFP36087.1 hypothetical protein SAMN02927913_1714 [Frateuria terrea]